MPSPANSASTSAPLWRVVRAHSRRIAAGDIEGIADTTALADEFAAAVQHAFTDLQSHGYSWADGAALRFSRRPQRGCGHMPTALPAADEDV